MSLVIQKFEPGGKTTQPRLYKRGNDDIDLDAYIRDAESEFSYWLANSRLKDKEKQQVQEAYSQMILGINDGTFTYKIGGGYNNSVGMSNLTKGFDAAGLAAGFLGNILRNQSVYEAPEEKPDPSKIEWKGNSSIGSALTRYLYGSDKESLNDFIDLDLPDPNTKKRGNANRSARFKSGLEYIRDNFDDLFTSFTDSNKATALEGINSALAAFDNGTVEDNEYLDLGRATGMSNLRDMFFAGEKYRTLEAAPITPGTGTVAGGGTYNNEDEWRAATHPRSNITNFTNRTLTTSAVYKREGRIKLNSILMGMSKDNLLKLIQTGLKYSPTGQELNKGRSILQGFGQLTSFENNFIIRLALEVMRRRNFLHQFSTDQNSYYIPFVSSKLDERGTGFVYTIRPDGNHILREIDRWDIPFYTSQWHNEFIGLVPSHKQGGSIRKFVIGGYLDYTNPFINDDDIYNISMLNKYNEATGKGLFKGFLGSNHTRGENAGLKDYSNKFTNNIASSSFTTDDAIAALQKYKLSGKVIDDIKAALSSDTSATLLDKLSAYNEKVSKIRAWQNQKQDWEYNKTGLAENNELFNSVYSSYGAYSNENNIHDLLGSATYARLALAYKDIEEDYKNRNFKLDGFDDNIWIDNAGYLHVGEYGKAPLTDSKSVTSQDTKLLEEDKVKGADTNPKTPAPYQVDETTLPPNEESINTNDWKEYIPYALRFGKLWDSLNTNRRVYNAVLPSLKPVLKDTYERYSPVTGAFSAMLLKNKQGADVLRLSYQPFTSDASLAAARMFEGLKQANQLLTEGFLMDDLEIKRTKAEALARQEDNMARRSEVANFNRASINQTNREGALLKASRLKSDYLSREGFYNETLQDVIAKLNERRMLSNSLREQINTDVANRWYTNVMELANREKDAWITANTKDGITPDITKWRKYNKYNDYRKRAEDMRAAMMKKGMAGIVNISYNSPYTDESYNMFSRTWI